MERNTRKAKGALSPSAPLESRLPLPRGRREARMGVQEPCTHGDGHLYVVAISWITLMYVHMCVLCYRQSTGPGPRGPSAFLQSGGRPGGGTNVRRSSVSLLSSYGRQHWDNAHPPLLGYAFSRRRPAAWKSASNWVTVRSLAFRQPVISWSISCVSSESQRERESER